MRPVLLMSIPDMKTFLSHCMDQSDYCSFLLAGICKRVMIEKFNIPSALTICILSLAINIQLLPYLGMHLPLLFSSL